VATFRAVTLDDIAGAPVVLQADHPIAASRQAVWDLLAGDPARWGDFAPGFDHSGVWTKETPTGVGAIRRVKVGGLTFHDEILANDPGARWGFRVESAALPVAKALVEDWVLEDAPGGCVLHWRAGVWPHGPAALNKPLLKPALLTFAKLLVRGVEKAARGADAPPAA
jgi:hypothetical protein